MSSKLETYKVRDWVVFGRTEFKPPFKVSDALINEARIVHVAYGHSRLYSAHQYMELSTGDTLVMKADNFVNKWQENEGDELNQVIAFQLNAEFLRYMYHDQLPSWLISTETILSNAVEIAEPSPLLNTFFEGLQSYFDHPTYLTEELICVKVRELISLLVQTDASQNMRNIFGNLFNASEYSFQEVIQQKLFEALNIEDLAFLTGMSLSSFKRKFSSLYGTSPNKYFISKRLEKAQILLNTTNLRISEIAYDCGFSDVGYFSKTFRNYFNCSPSDFRKN